MREDLKKTLQSKSKDGIKAAPAIGEIEDNKGRESIKPIVIRLCLACDKIVEAHSDPKRCHHCQKSFLPINYMSNIEPKNAKDFAALFSNGDELKAEDLIRGIFVIW